MTYPDSVRFLYSLGNELKTAKLGLDRITRLLSALGNPHHSTRFVHVAGTNGKGSVSAMIESGLRAAGLRTGLYTSPHLLEPVERIRVAGRPVTAEKFAAAFDQVHGASEELLTLGELDLHPTYFETVTAMAFLLFRDLGVERAVMEVGLGGRLDATNVIRPDLTVITRVDYDHEAWLGKTLEEIAAEKAGILKTGAPAVFAPQRAEVEAVLDRRAADLGVELTKVGACAAESLEIDRFGSRFRTGGLAISCPLAGEHQVENALTAVAALRILNLPTQAIEAGIAATRWPGRLERLRDKPEIWVDGAHNPSGAGALAAYIGRFYTGRHVTLVFGVMRDKSVEEMAGILFPLAQRVIVTAPAQGRSVRPETVAGLVSHPDLRTASALPAALGEARDADVVFVTGSLFLVGEAVALLRPNAML